METINFWYSHFGAIRLNQLLIKLFCILEKNYPKEIEINKLSKRLFKKKYSFKLILKEINIISCSYIIEMNYNSPKKGVLIRLTEFGKDVLLSLKKEAPYELKEMVIDIKKMRNNSYRLTILKTCSISLEYQNKLFSIGFKEYKPAFLRYSGNKIDILEKLSYLLKNFDIREDKEVSESLDSYLYFLKKYGTFYSGLKGNYSYFVLPLYHNFSFTREEISFLYKILEKGKRPIEWRGKALYLEDFTDEKELFMRLVKKGCVRYLPSKECYSLTSMGLSQIDFFRKSQEKRVNELNARIRKFSSDNFEISFNNASFLQNDFKKRLYKIYKFESEYPFMEIKNLSIEELTKVFTEVINLLE